MNCSIKSVDMGSKGREVRIGEGQRGSGFVVILFLSTLSLLQLEMNSKISRDEYRHSHSKNNHGLETQIYIFVLGFFKCFITNYITRFFIYLFIFYFSFFIYLSSLLLVLKMFLMFDLTRQSLHELFLVFLCLPR